MKLLEGFVKQLLDEFDISRLGNSQSDLQILSSKLEKLKDSTIKETILELAKPDIIRIKEFA